MKKFFEIVGSIVSFRRWGSAKRDGHKPYRDSTCNRLYNSLFCDKLSVLKREHPETSGHWPTLLDDTPSVPALRAITDDRTLPSRERLVAYRRLRDLQEAVVPRELLGVVIEVKLANGLDVLVAYSDMTVHYIHHGEKAQTFDPAPAAWRSKTRKLLDVSQTAVESIGPWMQARVPPPTEGMIRMSFLVSDGLYFGQGLLSIMDKDELAGPIISAGTELLKSVTQGSVS